MRCADGLVAEESKTVAMTRLGVYWTEGEDEDGRDNAFVSLPECLGAFEAVQPRREGSLKKRVLEGLACSALLAGFVLVIVLVVDPSSGPNSPEKTQNLRLQVKRFMKKRNRLGSSEKNLDRDSVSILNAFRK